MDLSRLSASLKNDIDYPPQMLFAETGILGRGFYPGCFGYSPERSPIDGLMLLGRDFGTKSYYDNLCGLPSRDESALTWRHTRDIYLGGFHDLPVWCTNYLMGIRSDGSAKGSMKERVAAAEWSKYEQSCWSFLQKQVLLQRPRVIVVFGEDNRSDLTVGGRFGKNWSCNFKHIFATDGVRHSAMVTFTNHPHSLIRKTAKDVARIEVQRIRELYQSGITEA
jgi:hypothetical protein